MPAPASNPRQLLLHRKIHVADGAYTQSGRGVRARFSSGWSAAIELADRLADLPEAAIDWWAAQPNGHLLLTAADDTYATSLLVEGEIVQGVAALPIFWLIEDPSRALAAALRPLDHLLGCAGEKNGPWLSDGGGITPRWQWIGEQISRLFPLGYGGTEASRQDPHAYLAQGFALALTDRRSLNAADPKLERLIGASLLSPGFWKHAVTAT